MKKKSLKNLKLNKKSISNLSELDGVKGGSWYYCGTEGMGCYLMTRLFDDCPKGPDKPQNSSVCATNGQDICDYTIA